MTNTTYRDVLLASVLAFASAAALVGCATDEGRRRPPHDAPPGAEGRGRAPNVFISPLGEPYRAGPKDPYPVAVWFARANASGTGQMTEAEFIADAERFFRVLDANHDGVIDGFELADYEHDIAPEIQPKIRGLRPGEGMDDSLKFDDREGQSAPRRRRGGQRGGSEGEGGGGQDPNIVAADLLRQGAGVYGLLPDPEPVASASSDLNGKITLSEWRDAARRRFARLTLPGHATVALADLPKTPAQIMLEARRREDARRAGQHP